MQILQKALIGLLLVGFASLSKPAETTELPPGLLENAANFIPGLRAENMVETPIPGLYQAIVGPNVIFLSADGNYMLHGDLVDLRQGINLTDAARLNARYQAIELFNENEMIVFAPPTPHHTITVFTDVDCSYCAQLHRDLPRLLAAGVKVRYLLYPRTGLDSSAYWRWVSVWCAPDRHKALASAKTGGYLPARTCVNPVRAHYELGRIFEVKATPTIVLENGVVIPGYISSERLLRTLDSL